MGFIPGLQGWLNVHNSINVIRHINKRKEPYDPLNKVELEETYINIIKAAYEKPQLMLSSMGTN